MLERRAATAAAVRSLSLVVMRARLCSVVVLTFIDVGDPMAAFRDYLDHLCVHVDAPAGRPVRARLRMAGSSGVH